MNSNTALTSEILRNLRFLGDGEKGMVLKYVKSMVKKKKPEKVDFMKYFGTIDEEDINLMNTAIKEDCGKIDHNEW